MLTCIICNGRTLKGKVLYDDRYGYKGLFRLVRCAECGHMFLEDGVDKRDLEDLYSNYYPRRAFDIDSHKPRAEASGFKAWFDGEYGSAFRWVPEKVKVLDIGCGFGETLGYHKARGCDVFGVEADENIRRVADKFGYKVHVGLFDPSLYEENCFDYVTMDQVIEHVLDPVETLRGVARVLKPGGLAILSTPNGGGWGAKVFGRRWINWHVPYHNQFFSVRSMRMAAEKAGLSLEKTITITASAWLHYQWIHLLTRPREGTPSVFWSPDGRYKFPQIIPVAGLALISRLKIDHMATRLFDAMGIGDNRLFFLRKESEQLPSQR
ncbi:MAG: class I SAM-dependent methyltransferase [Nitrospiraceae bacterium]|nr:class I SAM-dependent methyltransferase [Nitrospiraceae bacterium]